MKTKKQYKYFSIFNHEKEQDYLREMNKIQAIYSVNYKIYKRKCRNLQKSEQDCL